MIDLSNVPGVVIIENTSNQGIKIQSRPGYTQGFTLPAGESVKIRVETSAELINYLGQENIENGLKVTLPEEVAETETVKA